MKEHVLITGGAGYLGSIMVPFLLTNGFKVTVLDNLYYRQHCLLECCSDHNFVFVNGDCRDETLIKQLIAKADVIIPLAALVGAPLCDRDRIAATTVNRDAVIMINNLRSQSQKLLIPITNSGYGIGGKSKFCTEETPLHPISLYGKLKVETEKAILDSDNAISFRLATVFGAAPRMRTDLLVNDFVYRAGFDREHHRLFHTSSPSRPVEVCGLRVTAEGRVAGARRTSIGTRPRRRPRRAASTGRAYVGGRGSDVSLFDRRWLEPGDSFEGPAIVTEYSSTVLVAAGWRAQMDDARNLRLDRGRAGRSAGRITR